jgi:hypothetical protein
MVFSKGLHAANYTQLLAKVVKIQQMKYQRVCFLLK